MFRILSGAFNTYITYRYLVQRKEPLVLQCALLVFDAISNFQVYLIQRQRAHQTRAMRNNYFQILAQIYPDQPRDDSIPDHELYTRLYKSTLEPDLIPLNLLKQVSSYLKNDSIKYLNFDGIEKPLCYYRAYTASTIFDDFLGEKLKLSLDDQIMSFTSSKLIFQINHWGNKVIISCGYSCMKIFIDSFNEENLNRPEKKGNDNSPFSELEKIINTTQFDLRRSATGPLDFYFICPKMDNFSSIEAYLKFFGWQLQSEMVHYMDKPPMHLFKFNCRQNITQRVHHISLVYGLGRYEQTYITKSNKRAV